MNNQHRKTLPALFVEPVNGNLQWMRIEALLITAECTIVEGKGSAVTFAKEGRRLNIHRPHPGKEALKYRVVLVREFLQQLGVTP